MKKHNFIGIVIASIPVILYLTPLIFTVFNAYAENYAKFKSFGSFEFLKSFLLEKRQLGLFFKSAWISSLSAFLALILGFSAGFLLFRTDFNPKFLKYLIPIPLLISPYIFGVALSHLFARQEFKENIFAALGFNFNVFNPIALIFVFALSYFPVAAFIAYIAFRFVSKNYEEAASLITSRRKFFLEITLPYLLPYIVLAFFIIFALSLTDVATSTFLHVNTFSSEIFAQLGAYYNLPYAISLTIPLLLIFAMLIFLNFEAVNKLNLKIPDQGELSKIKLTKISKIFSGIFMALLIFLSVFLPLSALLIQASELKNFEALFKVFSPLKNSISVSIIASSISVALAFLIGYFHHNLDKHKSKFDIFYLAPLIIPFSIMALSISVFWNSKPFSFLAGMFYGTPLILTLFYISFNLPLASKLFSIYFDRFKKTYEESANLITGKRLAIFSELFLKPSLPIFAVSFIFFFIINLREIDGTIILYPPGFETLSVRIFTLFHYGAPEVVASLSLVLITILIISYIVILRCVKWFWK